MLNDIWRPRAQLDLESIIIYLAVECKNQQAAVRAEQKIIEAVDMIREFPDSGGSVHFDQLEQEYRTALVNPYIIYYTYNKEAVTICRILHQRQEIDTYSLVPL